MTPLVIVCGPPAVGKTTLAKMLSAQLGLPVLSKDSLKEALMDHLGGGVAVGAAAFAVQFATARELLASGVGIILEGPFFVYQAELAEHVANGGDVYRFSTCELSEPERRSSRPRIMTCVTSAAG